jgi:Protein of unknown function (DUF1565)
MNASAYTRIPVIILAAVALTACPWKKNKHHDDDDHAPSIYYVSVSAGLDTNPGTQTSQFKTITHALSVATRSGTTVQVAPGTYSSGETFPITVPAGVLLIGDETNKGGGGTPTSIVGGGQVPASPVGTSAALLPGAGSTIAGFAVTNNNGSFSVRRGLSLGNSTVTLRNNTVTGATHKVGVYIDASTNHVITGNRIVDNGGSSAGTGLAFSKGGVGSKVENNVITGNGFGVEYDVAGGDLGGGSAGSAGGNVISCNTQNGIVSFAPSTITITAASNLWDHAPPTRGPSTGDDIYDSSGMATINAIPAAQTSNPPPCAGSTFYVAVSGGVDDMNHGTQSLPFKTITFAMTVATTSGSTVQVAPGIYDVTNNHETFPITVPDGVLLIGDETNKGGGATPTTIFGGGLAPGATAGTIGVALLPGTGSTIAGFTITNDDPAFAVRRGVILGKSNVTLRNNTVTGAVHAVGVHIDASTNHVITGNRIVNNGAASGTGLDFVNGGVGSKLENNVITGNGYGVVYEVAGGDLGGGSASSAGGNVISCNTNYDLAVAAATPITVSAAGNSWDHLPPTLGLNTGDDIADFSGTATITATSPMLAANACP